MSLAFSLLCGQDMKVLVADADKSDEVDDDLSSSVSSSMPDSLLAIINAVKEEFGSATTVPRPEPVSNQIEDLKEKGKPSQKKTEKPRPSLLPPEVS